MSFSRPKKSDNRGIVFFMTLALLAIVVLICSAIAIMVLRDTYSIKRVKYSTQAYFLAEAGIEEALRDINNDFSAMPSGIKNLGDSACTYTLSTKTYGTDLSRKAITSIGTVKGVSRTIIVQVHYAGPNAFNYPALGGGKLTIAGDSTVSGSVHSNSPAGGAVEVGNKYGFGIVSGNASACGTVSVYTIDGESSVTTFINNAPYVELPPLDDNFFQYYYSKAAADGKAYSGNKTFSSNPCTGTNHVVYVDGQVNIKGTWSMTGCIVATKKIIINKGTTGHITQTKYENLPAFMSKNSDVEIFDHTFIEGMIYANGFIEFKTPAGTLNTLYGTVYGKNWVNIQGGTDIHYVRPNPPGLSTTITIQTSSWSEG